MSDGPVTADDFPLRELNEYIHGGLGLEHEYASPAAFVEDDDVRHLLIFGEAEYDPNWAPELPDSFWETKFAKRLMRKYGTEAANRAIYTGDDDLAASLTGLTNYESDVSGLNAVNQLGDWLIESNQMKIIYLAGVQGAGKTAFSLTMLEVVSRYFERAQKIDGVDTSDVPEPQFAANFSVRTPKGVDFELVNEYGQLVEWLEGGSSSEQKWFVFDEASTELTAQSSQNAQRVVDRMNELVKKGRKSGLSGLVTVGHDKKDVAPLFRMLAEYVEKTDTKTASFYSSVRDREGVGHLFDLSGIPETSWGYDTDDSATWSWSGASGDGYTDAELRELRDRRIGRLYERVEGITQSELADAFEVSPATVNRAVGSE